MSDIKPLPARVRPAVLKSEGAFILAAFAVFLAMAWTMVTYGHKQFGGHDTGVLIDVAYRLYCGYRPYVDFPITQPILFYLGGLWALQLFGVTWSAFVYVTVLFSGLTFALQVTMLRRIGISKGWTMAIAAGVQIGALLPLSSWWYNPSSSVVVSLLITAGVLVLKKPAASLNWALYCASLFLASLGKPNVAGIAILSCSLAILLRKETRVKGVLYSFLAAGCSLALLAIYRLNPLVVLHSYFSAAGRGVPTLERFAADQVLLMGFWQVATPVVMILPLLALLARRVLTRRPWQVDAGCTIVLLGGVLASLIGSFTNGEVRVTDATMMMTSTALLCLLTRVDKQDPAIRLPIFLQRVAIAFAIVIALWMCVTRYRVQIIGPFFEPGEGTMVGQRNAFFSKLKCGPIMIGILEDISSFLLNARVKMEGEPKVVFNSSDGSFTVEREPKIFFGPRMTWGYAAFKCEPPRGLPYSWWAGVDYPQSQLPSIVENFKRADFDYCVFYAPVPNGNSVDLTYVPQEIIDIISSDYTVCERKDFVIMFARKARKN